ncbi:MAG: hypothetical protein ACK46X_12355, partial [Candidatus Sericytochromatia bacterium]
KAMGDKIGLNDAYSLLGNAYLTLGRFPQAKDAFVRNQRLCFECGLADDEIFAFINLAIVALEMGEFTRGRTLATAAKERAVASGSRFCLSLALALEALANAYLAELTGVTAGMDEAVAIARELKNKYLEINVLVWQAEALLIFGRLTDAVEVAQAATALMEELGYREFEPRLLVFQAEVHGRLAERDEAHELLARAHDLARDNQNAGMTARVLKTLSWLSLQEKNLLQARDHARQALEVAEGVGAAYLAGEAHWLLGEVDLAAGQHEQATRELLKALDAGESTESPHLQCLALFCLARAADDQGVEVREYGIIYRMIEDLERAMKGMLEPERETVLLGKAEVRAIFKVGKTGVIGGAYVTEGKLQRNADIKVVRAGEIIHTGKFDALKRFKDDVREVATGYECGVSFDKFNDLQEGDIVEAYITQDKPAK